MAAKQPKRLKVSDYLRQLADETHEVMEDDGRIVCKAEALAILLWKRGLGYTERSVDDQGNVTETVIRSEWQAVLTLLDRLEGKVSQAAPDEDSRLTAADKVSELAVTRLNSLAEKLSVSIPPPPPVTSEKD